MWDVRDVGCAGCGMCEMWDVDSQNARWLQSLDPFNGPCLPLNSTSFE